MPKAIRYSIIIPSYNSERTIRACLQSVTQQDFGESYEVIVVDSSQDATPVILHQEFPPVQCLHLDRKTDPGTARNLGIRQAQGDILCFLDADCVAAPSWLRACIQAHHSEYAAVGGAVLNGNPESLVGWAGYLAEFREFFPFHPKQLVPHIASCNISYKRWVFERYGFFSPDYYPQEDLVFNIHLQRGQEAILFEPAMKVAHLNKTSQKHFYAHQRRIGRITSQVLRGFPELHGSWIARSRLLTLLAAPGLPWIKFVNTLRVAALSRSYLYAFFRAVPFLLIGLVCWQYGFIEGVFREREAV